MPKDTAILKTFSRYDWFCFFSWPSYNWEWNGVGNHFAIYCHIRPLSFLLSLLPKHFSLKYHVIRLHHSLLFILVLLLILSYSPIIFWCFFSSWIPILIIFNFRTHKNDSSNTLTLSFLDSFPPISVSYTLQQPLSPWTYPRHCSCKYLQLLPLSV